MCLLSISKALFFAKVSRCGALRSLCGVLSNVNATRSRACVHFYFLHMSQMRRHYHHIPSICVFGLLLQTWHFDLHDTEVFTYPLILIVAQQGKLGRKKKHCEPFPIKHVTQQIAFSTDCVVRAECKTVGSQRRHPVAALDLNMPSGRGCKNSLSKTGVNKAGEVEQAMRERRTERRMVVAVIDVSPPLPFFSLIGTKPASKEHVDSPETVGL